MYLKYLLALLSYFSFGLAQQTFLEQPKNTSALIGSNATLNCIVQNLEGEVTWCKDSFCTFGNRKRNQSDSIGRYSIVGNETKGEFNLHIKNLTINDDGLYQCQVTASEKTPALKSTIVGLTVLVAPSSINISQNIKDDKANVKVILRDNTTLECISEGANPAPDINWYLNGQLIKADAEVLDISVKIEKGSNKLFKTTSKLIIRAFTDSKWNEKEIKCEAVNEATKILKVDVSDIKNLQVKYLPIINIRTPVVNEILDGEYVQFECEADSRPKVTNYKWSIESSVFASGPNERFLTLKIFNSSMHKKVLKCDATNEVGTQTANFTLDVIYGPKFIRPLSSHKLVQLKDTLNLVCEVSSNPQAQVIWKHNNLLVYSLNGNLTVPNMKEENYGMYTCEASLKNFPIIASHVKVIPPGAPVIKVEPIQYAYFDSRVNIECYTEVEPKAENIIWYKQGEILNVKTNRKYRTNSVEYFNQDTKHTLTVFDFQPDDFSNYTCMATNKYGSIERNIELLPKSNPLANFLVFFTIIGFSIVTLCTITGCIIFKYFKKNPGKFNLQDLNPISSIEKWLEDKADLLFAPKKKKRKQSRANSTSKVQAKLVTFASTQPVTHGSFAMSPFQYNNFSPVYYSDEFNMSVNEDCGTEETNLSEYVRSYSNLRIDSSV